MKSFICSHYTQLNKLLPHVHLKRAEQTVMFNGKTKSFHSVTCYSSRLAAQLILPERKRVLMCAGLGVICCPVDHNWLLIFIAVSLALHNTDLFSVRGQRGPAVWDLTVLCKAGEGETNASEQFRITSQPQSCFCKHVVAQFNPSLNSLLFSAPPFFCCLCLVV